MENDIKKHKAETITGRLTENDSNSIDLIKPELLRKQVSSDEYEKILNEANGGGSPGFGTWLRKNDWKEFHRGLDRYNFYLSREEERKNGMET